MAEQPIYRFSCRPAYSLYNKGSKTFPIRRVIFTIIFSEQKEDISHLERKIKDLQGLLDKKNEELKEAEWQIEKLKKEKEELKEAEAKMYQQKIEFEDKNLDAAKRSENDEAKIKELEVFLFQKKG